MADNATTDNATTDFAATENFAATDYDVFIAGSGPVACTFARIILDERPRAKIYMAEIGSQDNAIVGGHHKNSIKKISTPLGALQPFSIPPGETHQSTLGGIAWRAEDSERRIAADGNVQRTGQVLVYQGRNPNQDSTFNLRDSAVTRTVGGMSTHWTANCPRPEENEERAVGRKYVPTSDFNTLFQKAGQLLNVHPDQYDKSIRHSTVRRVLQNNLPATRRSTLANLDLAVERRRDNPDFVTWSSAGTILGTQVKNQGFKLDTEVRVTKIIPVPGDATTVAGVQVRNLNTGKDVIIRAKAYVIACGAICTPQILANSAIPPNAFDRFTSAWNRAITPASLGRYLCEQSIAFCQIVLAQDTVDAIPNTVTREQLSKIREHQKKHPADPIPIPFSDPEPQLTLRYAPDYPWHVQIHRDAFSYGDVGPKADSRVVVDLRWFGKSDINQNNRVIFGPEVGAMSETWVAGVTDLYGMPQPTFIYERSKEDRKRDQRMMKEMCEVANLLGGYVPGSYPQFMEPGLALHITGTTRMGDPPVAGQIPTSVVDSNSKMHNIKNLWLGGCNVIPDSVACNPTRTAVAYAIRSARSIVQTL